VKVPDGLQTEWDALKATVTGIVAVVVGYYVLAYLSTVVQEYWLGGVTYLKSSRTDLILAGIFTPPSGIPGGFVAGWIGRRAPLVHGLVLSTIIGIETTYLYRKHVVDGPLWFEAGAGIALAGCVMLGSWCARYWLLRGRARAK
jgi:hypothetical protein